MHQIDIDLLLAFHQTSHIISIPFRATRSCQFVSIIARLLLIISYSTLLLKAPVP